MNDFVSLDNITSSIVKVSEKISDKNINTFILNNIKNKNHQVFFSYLYLTNEYFICTYENRKLAVIDLILENLKDRKINNKKILVYFENYFILFDSLEFYYFQKVEKEFLSHDLNEYVKKRFKFDVDEVIYLNSSELKIKKSKSCLKFVNNNKLLKIYIFYLFILILLTLLLIFHHKNSEDIKIKEKIVQKNNIEYKTPLKDTLSYKISLVLKKIENENLQISKIDFNKNSLNIIIVSKNRSDIYNFLEKYKNIKVNSFLKVKGEYEVNSTLTF